MKTLELKSGIYKIESVLTKKCYIGSANNVFRRKKEHFLRLKKGVHINPILQNHVNKYGINDLLFHIIELCKVDELIDKEQLYINKLNPKFNIRLIASSNKGLKHSLETIAKLREKNIGENNPRYNIHLYGENAPAYGLVHTDESKIKISESSKIRWKDPQYIEKQKSKIVSDETKKKMSLSRLGKKQSQEEIEAKKERVKKLWQDPIYRENHIKGMKGIKHTEEHKKKNREARLLYWQNPENRDQQCKSRKLSWEKRKNNKVKN